MDVHWKHPWTSIVCSPTGCGKTVFHDSEEESHGASRKTIIEFREGLPRAEDYSSDPLTPKLVIIDDLIRESSSSDAIVDLFTKGSHHHKNLSVILISHNLFHQGRGQHDISFNANYIVVFKNPRDCAQIRHLARQVFPDDPKFLEEACYDATSRLRINSLKILQALQHLRVGHAEVYPADRLPRVWTRSTVIVANTDNHDRAGQHWVFYIDGQGTRTYFDRYGLPPLDQIPPATSLKLCFNGTPCHYKERFRKLAENTVAYFYISCVMVIIFGSFLICFPMIVNTITG
ncbi:hypothetical protein DMN91_006961 [Ooceraea biroi]|uniref:Uncharacterized protein n=1 Tax=Ooceraea biroi TaxID=2015173 RepID=A0A3L8DJL1_OOCBI|nr:hypothetical protein DMN91_006961 [Ooceraea biroi]